jgi:hypothetical protein
MQRMFCAESLRVLRIAEDTHRQRCLYAPGRAAMLFSDSTAVPFQQLDTSSIRLGGCKIIEIYINPSVLALGSLSSDILVCSLIHVETIEPGSPGSIKQAMFRNIWTSIPCLQPLTRSVSEHPAVTCTNREIQWHRAVQPYAEPREPTKTIREKNLLLANLFVDDTIA